MPRTPLQPHYKNARARKQVFLPPPPPQVVPLPVPVRSPSGPPVRPVREALTPKTGMTRNELNEKFADIHAAIAERFEKLKRINDPRPQTIYAIRDRQDKVVENVNQLVP